MISSVSLDLEIDMLDSRACRWEQRKSMMDGVKGHQRGPADPVAGLEVENCRPELFRLARVGHAKADMTELVDASVPGREIAPTGRKRTDREIDRVAAGVLEVDVAHAASGCGLFLSAAVHRKAERLQGAFRTIEFLESIKLETHGLIGRVALKIANIVISVIATGVNEPVFAPHDFQANDVLSEGDCILKIGGAKAAISKSGYIDHRSSPLFGSTLDRLNVSDDTVADGRAAALGPTSRRLSIVS